MRKTIYVIMITTEFGNLPEVAFNSAKEAEEYGKQKYDTNKDYNWYISSIYLEDKD
nr:MAG TPA: hypothetical protein [Crassvirales sp.]